MKTELSLAERFVAVPLVPADRWPEIVEYIPEEIRGDYMTIPFEAIGPTCDAHGADKRACMGSFWIPCTQPGRAIDQHLWRPHEDGCDICRAFSVEQPYVFGEWPGEEWKALPYLSNISVIRG